MSKPELTPSELLFQSFRHSQGSISPQIHIFRYMHLEYDIRPDLHPTAETFQRYAKFLAGDSSRGHLSYPDNPEQAVYWSIKSLRKYYNESQRSLPKSKEANLYPLTSAILSQEIRILDQDKPWANWQNGKTKGRPERLEQRVASGKGSFLYYYGREGQPTGRDEFDAMYADMWSIVETAAENSPGLARRVEKHSNVLLDAELAILGHAALAVV